MAALAEFPLEDGGSVFVEVAAVRWEGGATTRRIPEAGELTTRAGETFQAALGRIQPAAAALIARLQDLADRPDEVELEFGIQLSAEFGAVVARGSGDANFKIRMHWTSPPKDGP
jgi:Trypsin-co-occurring domain 1